MKVISVLVALVSVNFAAVQFVSSYVPQPFIYPSPVGSSNNDNEGNKQISETDVTLMSKSGVDALVLSDTEKYPEGRKPFWLINQDAIAAQIGLPPPGSTESVMKLISVGDSDDLKPLVMSDGPKFIPEDDQHKFVVSEDGPKSVEGDGGHMSEGNSDGIKVVVSEDKHESLAVNDRPKSVEGVGILKSVESGTGTKIVGGENKQKSVGSEEGNKFYNNDDKHKSFANEDGNNFEEFYDSSEDSVSSYEDEE